MLLVVLVPIFEKVFFQELQVLATSDLLKVGKTVVGSQVGLVLGYYTMLILGLLHHGVGFDG